MQQYKLKPILGPHFNFAPGSQISGDGPAGQVGQFLGRMAHNILSFFFHLSLIFLDYLFHSTFFFLFSIFLFLIPNGLHFLYSIDAMQMHVQMC